MWLEALLAVLLGVYIIQKIIRGGKRLPEGVKPFTDIPGPRGLPVIGTFHQFLPGQR